MSGKGDEPLEGAGRADLFTAIRNVVEPHGGLEIPEHPRLPLPEPPDFSGPEYAWLETDEGRAVLRARFRRLFAGEGDDA
jgi:hypothetical protein